MTRTPRRKHNPPPAESNTITATPAAPPPADARERFARALASAAERCDDPLIRRWLERLAADRGD